MAFIGFASISVAAMICADLSAPRPDPWVMMQAMASGIMSPDFSVLPGLLYATALTLAFAFAGVSLGALIGLFLAPFYRLAIIRALCVSLRAVHELFWALVLLNLTGLSPLTGVLSIGLPYAGIFAKVFAEYLEETDPSPIRALPQGLSPVTQLIWMRLPQCVPQIRSYLLYRLECGIRSSAVLGFIGLPTLGFQLESSFKQAHYDQAVVVLALFFALILPMRYWMRWRLVPLFWIASVVILAQITVPPMGGGAVWRFIHDIVPAPMRTDAQWSSWLSKIFIEQAAPGVWSTIIMSQVALAVATVFAALAFPMIVPRVAGRIGALLGHGVLVMIRSTPEYMLAFILLQWLGPSMLPAILALAVHNGAIVAHLLGRHAHDIRLRHDAPRGLTLWGWELMPRLAGNFWALCLYRWEIILRESAIMGMLGLGTLGFYIQKNVQELRLDRVVMLLIVSILLTWVVDTLSRGLRQKMRIGDGLKIEGGRGKR
ncbi:ABC transporter permease [Thioclava sp. SK-1]|uniref:PhnE/PtxC family ABC transporter permease n=1 Tax=Thioclava sp. SK-1 TaxID=1889770 RepID=UPI0009F4579C|nr:ABC transporter permease [Thioclava sp. SK-1]